MPAKLSETMTNHLADQLKEWERRKKTNVWIRRLALLIFLAGVAFVLVECT